MRHWRAARGATTRDYDSDSDKYTIHPASLANLVTGTEAKAKAAGDRRHTIRRLMVQGRSIADVVLITGISRAAVYRLSKAPRNPLLD